MSCATKTETSVHPLTAKIEKAMEVILDKMISGDNTNGDFLQYAEALRHLHGLNDDLNKPQVAESLKNMMNNLLGPRSAPSTN